jgi:hypothetical protein
MENITLKPVSVSREVDVDIGEGTEQRDESALTRLGKRPVLKVSTHFASRDTKGDKWTLCLCWFVRFLSHINLTQFPAEFWLHVNFGLQLHDTHHMGGHLDVSLLVLAWELWLTDCA